MTKDRKRKKDIQARMEASGRRYTAAAQETATRRDVVDLAMNEYGHVGSWAVPDPNTDLYHRVCRDSTLGRAISKAHAERKRCTDGCEPWQDPEGPSLGAAMCRACMRPLCNVCQVTPVEWDGRCDGCITPETCGCYVPACDDCTDGHPDDCTCPPHAEDCQYV